jgi:excisionase family DNA binding protein
MSEHEAIPGSVHQQPKATGSARKRLANPAQLRIDESVRPAAPGPRLGSRGARGPASAGQPADAEVLTPEDVADLLHVDRETVYRMARRHEIPAFKVGTKWRFRRVGLRVWMQELEARAE